MAKALVTREAVFEAADVLAAAGDDPSILAVQGRIGGGSYSTVKRFLDTWMDRIANYFRHHQSSGFVEGLNNKLKVLKRRCYGMYNLRHLFQRITLDLEGYRRFRPAPAPTY